MSDLKQCDICKSIISKNLYTIHIYKWDNGFQFYADKPRKEIEVCRECLGSGFTLLYADFRKYKDN